MLNYNKNGESMKKYILSFFIALTVGFLLCKFFLNQYDDYTKISVSSIGDTLYFIQYGVFSSLESMEENTINLENYVYNIDEEKYYVYIGITKDKENKDKLINYYKSIGYDTIVKEYQIKNEKFINELNNYDTLLKETNDDTAIASIINQTLIKYEEVAINGSND